MAVELNPIVFRNFCLLHFNYVSVYRAHERFVKHHTSETSVVPGYQKEDGRSVV